MESTEGNDGEVQGEIRTNNDTVETVMEQIHQNTIVTEEESEPLEYDLWRINYEKLVKLLVKTAPMAMRHVFNSIHSPANLLSNLSRAGTMATLRRLRAHGLITEQQWNLIFSPTKTQTTSNDFDVNLLFVLLKNASPLTPPYPGGWHGPPQEADTSLSADLVRIQWYRMWLVSKLKENGGRLEEREHRIYWEKIKQVLARLGGASVKALLEQMEHQRSSEHRMDDRDYVKELVEWDNVASEISAKEMKLKRRHDSGGSDAALDDTYLQSHVTSQSRNNELHQTDRTSSPKDKGSHRRVQKKRSSIHSREITSLTADETRTHERSIMARFQKQLIETIQSDEIIPKLIQHGLLSHEEKNRISLCSRNADRMKLITELILKKRGGAFDKFCNAIKYKYKKLSDQLSRAKQSPFKVDKPDELSQCEKILRSVYGNTLKTITPIPWYPDVHIPIEDFIQPYYITDYNGRVFDAEDILNPRSKNEKRHRILVEGFDGVGKSTLLQYLAHQWEHGKQNTFLSKFTLVFLIQLKNAFQDVATTVLKQCLEPGGYVRTEEEVYSLIAENQESTLFLLDSYEDNHNIESNIWDLVQSTLYPHSTVVMTANSHFVTKQLRKNFDTRLVLLGVESNRQEDLIYAYAKLTHTSSDIYTGLLSKVTSENRSTIQSYALNPLYNLCLCLVSETEGNMDIHTMTSLMKSTVSAFSKLYAQSSSSKSKEGDSSDQWTKVTGILEKIAFESTQNGTVLIPYKELSDLDEPEVILRLGLLQEIYSNNEDDYSKVYSFTNATFQHYFAAAYLSNTDSEDFQIYLQDLIDEKSLQLVAVYLCGMKDDCPDLDLKIQDLLGVLAENNTRSCMPSRSATRQSDNSHEGTTNECRLSAVSLSLECLAEDGASKDIPNVIKNSLPNVIYMKQKIHHSPLSLQGLAKATAADMGNISELELQLDHIALYYEGYMLNVADAIGQSKSVVTLHLKWTSSDLLAEFLARVFSKNSSLRNLHMTDNSGSGEDVTSATVCMNMWLAGCNMHNLDMVSFTHCKNPSLVMSILHNIPDQLRTLYLNSCKFNLNCAQELMTKIEKSKSLQQLDLGSVRMQCSDFLYICYGLKRNKSLSKFILSDVKMEENAVEGLAEAVKFNTTLKHLELKHVKLNMEACRMIGNALHINSSLRVVNLVNAEVPDDGIRLLYRMKSAKMLLKGVDSRNIIDRINYNPLDHSQSN